MDRKTTKRVVSELKPNDVICVFGDWFRVRYLRYWGGNTTVDLQRETEQMTPFHDCTCLNFTVHPDTTIWIEVEVNL